MNVTTRDINEIKPYEANPRINDAAVDAVAASLKEFGFRQPIVVDADGVIIVGHTRWKAAKKLGLFTITGDLTVTDGTISLDGTTAEINVTADAASYATPMAKRNKHIHSADFLDVDQFPTIRFTGGTLTSDAIGDRHIAGEITIKGQTSPVDSGWPTSRPPPTPRLLRRRQASTGPHSA